jgi:hypothetical protein
MILAAHQAQYMPYPGLIAKIAHADVFVLQDDLQYVKQEWQNRNRIRTPEGWQWLSIPVHAKSTSPINGVFPVDDAWIDRHARLVDLHYRQCRQKLACVRRLWDVARPVSTRSLAEINAALLIELCRLFGVRTPIYVESALRLAPEECRTPDARLISLCQRFGCDTYLSGSGGLVYLNADRWTAADVRLRILHWIPEQYDQCYAGWFPNLSSLDLFLCGEDVSALLTRSSHVREVA